jgi:5-(aminomethyl)-3-furanmethanol phosphate kinase
MRELAGSLNIRSARSLTETGADPIAESTETASVSILKVGGSVLTLPDLVDRLQYVIRHFAIAAPVLIIGGGAAADKIRDLQPLCGLTAEAAHWMAIHAMTQNARWLGRLHRQIVCIPDRETAKSALLNGLLPALDCTAFLRHEELPLRDWSAATQFVTECRLPCSWSVTSDSIAAWIAARWPSASFWMLKSCDAGTTDLGDLAAQGRVDRCFPDVAADVSELHWINLRSAPEVDQWCDVGT